MGAFEAGMPTSSKTAQEAAEQITRGGHQWGDTLGEAVGPISFGFRLTAPAYDAYPHGTRQSFSQFTAPQIADATRALSLWADLANISFVRVGDDVNAPYADNATILFSNYYADRDSAAAFAFLADSEDT